MDDSVYQEAQAVLWDMAEPLLTYEQLLQKTYVEEVNKRKERAVSSEDGCGVVLKRICNYAEHTYKLPDPDVKDKRLCPYCCICGSNNNFCLQCYPLNEARRKRIETEICLRNGGCSALFVGGERCGIGNFWCKLCTLKRYNLL